MSARVSNELRNAEKRDIPDRVGHVRAVQRVGRELTGQLQCDVAEHVLSGNAVLQQLVGIVYSALKQRRINAGRRIIRTVALRASDIIGEDDFGYCVKRGVARGV